MQAEMLKLKKKYELAVETRNFTGIQLIDRNDELCILYEKSNVQEQTLKQGEMKLQELNQQIRMLRLELARRLSRAPCLCVFSFRFANFHRSRAHISVQQDVDTKERCFRHP